MSSSNARRRQIVVPLTLFDAEPRPTVPERFLIDEATKRRGRKHIARIKAQLEARHPSPPAGDGSVARASRLSRRPLRLLAGAPYFTVSTTSKRSFVSLDFRVKGER